MSFSEPCGGQDICRAEAFMYMFVFLSHFKTLGIDPWKDEPEYIHWALNTGSPALQNSTLRTLLTLPQQNKGVLHEKTRTGASFIRGYFLISYRIYMMTGSFHILLFIGTFHVDKIHVWFKIASITHALSIPVYRQTNFTPQGVVILCLHDTVARFHTGVKFSPWHENQGELTLGWLAQRNILW